jgi:hypothetical protein
MTQQIVSISALSAQTLTANLGGQSCQIAIYQKSTGLFIDLRVNNVLIIGGVLCLHAVKIVRDAYLGFSGDLAFYDTQGAADPVSTGLGSRWVLAYS